MSEFQRLGGYDRVYREIHQHMEEDAVKRWKGKPADARGATPPSNGLRSADVSETRSSNGPRQDPTPAIDWRQQAGLVGIDNEILRDLLEVAWTTITTLAPTGQNRAADAFRARIWAHLHDEEAECPNCHHYLVNRDAAGPCAVEGCDCQSNEDPS